jgi:hypothetical protein
MMNVSNFGRLIGAGLLALGLHAFAPSVAAQTLAMLTQPTASIVGPAPEPQTWALMIAGLAALWFVRRRA